MAGVFETCVAYWAQPSATKGASTPYIVLETIFCGEMILFASILVIHKYQHAD
jgi:hypothetical protein